MPLFNMLYLIIQEQILLQYTYNIYYFELHFLYYRETNVYGYPQSISH